MKCLTEPKLSVSGGVQYGMADVIASDDIGDEEKMMSQLLFHLMT